MLILLKTNNDKQQNMKLNTARNIPLLSINMVHVMYAMALVMC